MSTADMDLDEILVKPKGLKSFGLKFRFWSWDFELLIG